MTPEVQEQDAAQGHEHRESREQRSGGASHETRQTRAEHHGGRQHQDVQVAPLGNHEVAGPVEEDDPGRPHRGEEGEPVEALPRQRPAPEGEDAATEDHQDREDRRDREPELARGHALDPAENAEVVAGVATHGLAQLPRVGEVAPDETGMVTRGDLGRDG